jgi:hypothetical protein
VSVGKVVRPSQLIASVRRTQKVSGGGEGSVNSEAFAISSEPDAMPDEVAVVREGLHRFNFAATGLTQVHMVTLFVRDAGGAIRGAAELDS